MQYKYQYLSEIIAILTILTILKVILSLIRKHIIINISTQLLDYYNIKEIKQIKQINS